MDEGVARMLCLRTYYGKWGCYAFAVVALAGKEDEVTMGEDGRGYTGVCFCNAWMQISYNDRTGTEELV